MCAFDELSIAQPSSKPILLHYEVCVTQHEEYLAPTASTSDVSSAKSSSEDLCSPPAYEACTIDSTAPGGKSNFFRRIFTRNSAKKAELPSYREAELVEAWAKVGIDINDRSQGPRPKCTPEEWLGAMDGLFGAPTLAKSQRKGEKEGVVVHAFPGSRHI
ncbi:uncharacterized protein UTRI_03337_B [Ustilago trichophora]|uniref:Uncharacterized protein n=1 Tax=Ustilago trichophora TaxID=86804 RepID=A0A5C3E4H4_9BASI|nr:uncharacterized protein UTRI_03337_B [Ustilago trichophora]